MSNASPNWNASLNEVADEDWEDVGWLQRVREEPAGYGSVALLEEMLALAAPSHRRYAIREILLCNHAGRDTALYGFAFRTPGAYQLVQELWLPVVEWIRANPWPLRPPPLIGFAWVRSLIRNLSLGSS